MFGLFKSLLGLFKPKKPTGTQTGIQKNVREDVFVAWTKALSDGGNTYLETFAKWVTHAINNTIGDIWKQINQLITIFSNHDRRIVELEKGIKEIIEVRQESKELKKENKELKNALDELTKRVTKRARFPNAIPFSTTTDPVFFETRYKVVTLAIAHGLISSDKSLDSEVCDNVTSYILQGKLSLEDEEKIVDAIKNEIISVDKKIAEKTKQQVKVSPEVETVEKQKTTIEETPVDENLPADTPVKESTETEAGDITTIVNEPRFNREAEAHRKQRTAEELANEIVISPEAEVAEEQEITNEETVVVAETPSCHKMHG